MKKYRFLIIPSLSSIYDYRMVKGLSDSLNELGYFSKALKYPCDILHLEELCKLLNINVVIGINRTFEERSKKIDIRYISWFQDIFTSNFNLSDTLLEGDILYTLGTPETLGIEFNSSNTKHSNLFTGVDQNTVDKLYTVNSKKIDFSLAGFIPNPFSASWEIKKDLIWYIENKFNHIPILSKMDFFFFLRQLIFRNFYGIDYLPTSALLSIKDVVESIYEPLTGSLDIHKLSNSIESVLIQYKKPKYRLKKSKNIKLSELGSLLTPYYERFKGQSGFLASLFKYLILKNTKHNFSESDAFNKAISYFSNSYPRLLDRQKLINDVIDISRSLQLYGKGWDTHARFSPYFYGSLVNHEELLDLYRKTKINLANNTHGLGLHSRNLECMAVGGFLMMHTSPNENKEGGMAYHFLPGIHYASYNNANFKEEAKYWLKNESKRNEIGLNARNEIIKSHLWIHRAQKIIKDLGD